MLSSSSSVLEEAFGRRMLDGTAEWTDVPEVVRSSFYVLHKALRNYDRRLSRCEKSIADALARQARVELECGRQRYHAGASATVEREMHQQLALYKDELECKVDRSVFFATLQDVHVNHSNALVDKIQAHASRLDGTLLEMKSILSKKVRDVEDRARRGLDAVAMQLTEHSSLLQALQHVDKADRCKIGCDQVDERLAALESSVHVLGHDANNMAQRSTLTTRDAMQSAKDKAKVAALSEETLQFVEPRLQKMTSTMQSIDKTVRGMRNQIQALEAKLGSTQAVADASNEALALQLKFVMDMQAQALNQSSVQGTLPPTESVQSELEPRLDVSTTVDAPCVTEVPAVSTDKTNGKGSATQINIERKEDASPSPRPPLPPMEAKKLDLREKRQRSKARFDEVARRQKERLLSRMRHVTT
ncbi:Aste57867_13849 [Aphanomyces stellatus]|uniref:Aste57867_13849 protein n=1 Tax=Aphanomyces stellatus TaxID=120398 RepID=A0A485KZJ3_9STRA|nr:hypothetical protein As57867_013798 [Aphanomyces stellatus]VFT90680.1 Aste57867_13849 [Aphanomyces stellatus]